MARLIGAEIHFTVRNIIPRLYSVFPRAGLSLPGLSTRGCHNAPVLPLSGDCIFGKSVAISFGGTYPYRGQLLDKGYNI